MTPKFFCHQCGKQMNMKVNFCPFCGVNLSSLTTVASSSSTSAQTFTPFSPTNDDDDDDNSYIDRLTKLDIRLNALAVEIIKDKPLGESIHSILSQPPMKPESIVSNRSSPVVDQSKFLEEFRKEAGTSRNDKHK